MGMLFIFSIGVMMWLIYGLLLHSWPVIIANVATLLLSFSLLILKLFYNARDRHDAVEALHRARV